MTLVNKKSLMQQRQTFHLKSKSVIRYKLQLVDVLNDSILVNQQPRHKAGLVKGLTIEFIDHENKTDIKPPIHPQYPRDKLSAVRR